MYKKQKNTTTTTTTTASDIINAQEDDAQRRIISPKALFQFARAHRRAATNDAFYPPCWEATQVCLCSDVACGSIGGGHQHDAGDIRDDTEEES